MKNELTIARHLGKRELRSTLTIPTNVINRIDLLNDLWKTDFQAYIRELYSGCSEERHPDGFTALHDNITGLWYDLSGNLIETFSKPKNAW